MTDLAPHKRPRQNAEWGGVGAARAMIGTGLVVCILLSGCARYQEINATLPPPVSSDTAVDLSPTDPVLAAALAQAAEAETLAEEIATLERIAAELRARAGQGGPDASGLQARADALRARADALRSRTL